MKLYSELAEYYFTIEEASRKFSEEILFLRDTFKRHKIHTVLDIGCGTGEHIKELQGMGFKPLGVDGSPRMLEIAKVRFPHCQFELGKMEAYVAKQPVDAVICLYGTFNYLINDDLVQNFLRNCHKNLKQAGLLVLEIWNADPIHRIKRKPITTVSNVRQGATSIRRNRGFRLTRADDVAIVEVNYVYNLNQKDLKDKHTMRVFHFPQVRNFLDDNKFDVLHVYSNYDGEKYIKTGARMLIVAKKRS
ncbi:MULTISPECIES: class I SAM-dependent DNA methyltransferase [Leptospira]|uniref:SAM-dependent methyltransferase n=1 Tax=Leptospira harrisiae TaxID=2023189 RepID=A0A2N0AFS7_9LEPT|nr:MULTISPECIES: class I SAM-dependent methyltransferase [Leptospira]PKA23002.1 SAM-dependent methyltransferase [Leptospira sp. mixed culture ATI2-C-A1]MCW7487873.1 class I SAM-dependent methyltransferase [Leptospira meyeri]PJZ83124.1 SAM-dependent methyltransferase [Leptospira harrisiae]PKA07468.1 SAM-dependent methyltransferase [Leptospira harrisiae]TGL15645.1 class I SAM-dependent methyltransferase [Leptospira meyeri]